MGMREGDILMEYRFENAKLRKALEQAIKVGNIRMSGGRFQVTSMYPGVDPDKAPELVSVLKELGLCG
jgi:hypothetical protein